MTTKQTPAPGAFDEYISPDSATLAQPASGEHPAPKEVKAQRVGKSPKPPMGNKQKMFLLGGGGLVVLVAALTMFRQDDPPRPLPPADVAAILSASAPTPTASEPEPPFAGFQDATPTPVLELASTGDPTLDALNAISTGDIPDGEAMADAAEMAPFTPPESAPPPLPAQPVDQPAPPAVASVAAESPPALDQATRMRIEALESDLKRAQAARRAAERNQRAPVTVVAVLDDGVVVRDARGRENVFAVGEQVK